MRRPGRETPKFTPLACPAAAQAATCAGARGQIGLAAIPTRITTPPMRYPFRPTLVTVVLLGLTAFSRGDDAPRAQPTSAPVTVGATVDGGVVVATQQLIRPAGKQVEFHGRPVDLALSGD